MHGPVVPGVATLHRPAVKTDVGKESTAGAHCANRLDLREKR
jgi:hypothetical protein